MTARMKKLWIALVLLCVTAVLRLPVAADELAAVCEATAVPAADAEALTDEIVVDDFSGGGDGEWMTSTGIAEVAVQTKNGVRYLSADVGYEASPEYGVMCVYGENAGLNLMTKSRLRFSVYIPGEEEENHTVRLTLYSGMESMIAEAAVRAGAWHTFTADVGEWDLRTYIHMCEITVIDGGSGVSGFVLGGITAGGRADLEVAETFLTFGFDAEGGGAVYEDGVYHLTPGSDGAMTLLAHAARTEYTAGSGVSAVRVVLDNALEGGVISLAVSDGGTDAASFTISSTCPIYYGENTYLLPYDSDIALHAYRLSFHSLYPDAAEAVTLRSVSLVTFPDTDSADYAGKVSVCGFDEGMQTLTVSGTLSASVAAQYIDARLALFEIPMWSSAAEVLASGEPVLTMKLSTKFTFTLPLSGREHTASASRYQVVLMTETERIPVAAAVYPDQAAQPAGGSLSVIGLCGADNAGVFDSNASSVIIDVYVDRLLGGAEGNTSGRLCVRGGQNYYLDNAYIRELDSEIHFCLSADVEVYLRLICDTDLSAKGYTLSCEGADFFAFDVHSAAGASMLGAVTDFLAARYSTASGFIVGERLDAAVYNGADMSDPDAYAALCADTMRLVYNSAVSHIPGVYVIAPLGHYEKEIRAAGAENADDADAYCDPVLLSSMISRRILRDGEMPWGLLYISDNASEALGHTQNILSQMRSAGCALPHATMLLWQPSAGYAPDILLAEYDERCAAASRADMRVLFLSVESFSQADRETICAGLKYTLSDTEFRRPLSEYSAEILEEKPLYTGWYVLSDFSRSYSTLGWIAGSGCARLITESSYGSGGRSLHAVFEPEDGSLFSPVSGNILCVSGVTDNLTYAPHVIYSLQVTTQVESAAAAELIFIFGSGDVRAEYSVTVPTGVPLEILCDLSDFAGADTVDFSAISVRCSSAASLDITQITACSEENDSSALRQLYRYRSVTASGAAEESGGRFTAAQKMIIGAMILGSVMGFALFSRRRGGKDA